MLRRLVNLKNILKVRKITFLVSYHLYVIFLLIVEALGELIKLIAR